MVFFFSPPIFLAMAQSKTHLSVPRFVVMAQSLPRSMKVRGVRGDKEIGVTCLGFNHEDPDTFLVGSESGCIFRCSMHAKGSPAGSKNIHFVLIITILYFSKRSQLAYFLITFTFIAFWADKCGLSF